MSGRPALTEDGRAARWSGQHERRREQFVEAALVAIAEHGPEVSTEQIAQQAGVARTRLYKHFAGAHALNQAIAGRAAALITAELEPVWSFHGSPHEMIASAVTTHVTWLTAHRNLYFFLSKHSSAGVDGPAAPGGADGAGGADVVTDIKGTIAVHLTGLLRGYTDLLGVDASIVQPLAYGIVGFVDSAASRWVDEPGSTTLAEIVDQLSTWIWAILDSTLRAHGIEIDPREVITA